MKKLTTGQRNIVILKKFVELNSTLTEYTEISGSVAGVYCGEQLITFPIKVMTPEKVTELLNHQVKRLNKMKRGNYSEIS